ncbi:MAG: hypothetical protein V7640_972 [Betaproteobacteria bacterium]
MKRSEIAPERLQAQHDYIETRWTQLSDLSTKWGDEAVKYLLLVNSGAIAATLSFIGAMPHIRPLAWPKMVLLLFAVGVVAVGFYHAVRYHRIEWLFTSWRESVARYASEEVGWDDLVAGDEKRTKKATWPLVALAYSALLCFLSGLVIAGFNFQDITRAGVAPTSSTDSSPELKKALTLHGK